MAIANYTLLPMTETEWFIWSMAIVGSILVGIAKGGLKGIGIAIVTVFALAFGSRASTGILVPLLIIGDTLAVIYYNRHTQWSILLKLIPWTLAGLILGVWYGMDLEEALFKQVMAAIIIVCVIMMFWWDRKPLTYVPNNWWFAGIMGVVTGFTTMIGNLAGPFANIFFLAIRLPKNEFIGTTAWMFFILNIVKLPFHIWTWGTITRESLMINLRIGWIVVLGFIVGVRLVYFIQERQFRYLILSLTALGAIIILLR